MPPPGAGSNSGWGRDQFHTEIVAQLPVDKVAELPALPERGTLDLQGVMDSRFCFA